MSLLHWGTVGLLALGSISAMACGGDKKDDDGADDEEAPVGTATGALCDKSVTYATDIQPIMTKYCISCHATTVPFAMRHNAPTDHNFDSEEGIAKESAHADEDAASGPNITNTKMPPVDEYPSLNLPVPTVAERVTLGKWLACQMD